MLHAACGGALAEGGGSGQKESVACGEPMQEQTYIPQRKAHSGVGGLAGAAAHERLMLLQSVPEGLHSMVQTQIKVVLKELLSVGSPSKTGSGRTASLGRGPVLEQ